MAYQPIPMDPKYIIDLIVKKRWLLIVPFFLSLVVGIYMVVTLPEIYESQTLIMVEPQRVPSNYVQSIVSMDISARISTISQQIMSRTNLEKVIEDFNLFPEEKYGSMYLEDKLESLRKRIGVNVINRRHGADAFSISFKGPSPEKVMRVTNALASYFINENLKVREEQAIGTSDFLDVELQTMRKRLEEKEKALQDYKQKYMGGLPEQLQTNLSILNSLRTEKNEKQTIIRGIEENIYTLKNTANSLGAMGGDLSMDDLLTDLDDGSGGTESYELSQLREALERMKTKYTDKHPDVMQLKRRIRELEEKTENEPEVGESGAAEPETPAPVEPALPAIDFQAVQIAELKASLRMHQKELEEIDRQIEIYKQRVEDTPKREQELLSTQRDYDNLKSLYESLLSRKLESEIAVNMERRQKGEQFRILDSARLPEKPISPNMQILFVVFLGGGLGVGAGLIFIREYFDTSFKRPQDVEDELGLDILCTVPILVDARQKRLKRFERAGFLAFSVVSMLLFAAFSLLTWKGVEKSLDLIKKFVV